MFTVTTMADIAGQAVLRQEVALINEISVAGWGFEYERYADVVRHYRTWEAGVHEYLANTGLFNQYQLEHINRMSEGMSWITLPAPVTIEVVSQIFGWEITAQDYERINSIEIDEHAYYDIWYRDGVRYTEEMGLGYPSTMIITQPGIYTFRIRTATFIDFVIEVTGDQPAQQAQPQATTPDLSTASTWAHSGITQALTYSLIPANLQTNFTANATRAEFSAFAVALYETATGREITGRMQFNDTNDVNVQKMGYLGIVTGVGDGNFAPNNGITREQAAVMIARLAYAIGQPLPASAPTFADNSQVSSWAVDAVGQMQATGIMGGVGNNQFNPTGQFTREQSIITMLRLLEEFN